MKIHRMAVGPFGTNCVLVEDPATREALVIDPGGDREAIEERIRLLDLKPVMIVQTHGHMDHCMESSALATGFGIPIAMHSADLPLYRNIKKQVDALLGPGASAGYGIDSAVEPSVMLADGDRVKVGNIEAEVIHLPGHSPGGIGLLFRQEPPVLISGDTLFRDGVGRTDLWGGDWETLLNSIRQRIFTLPDDTKVVSGHGGDTTVGREKASFPY